MLVGSPVISQSTMSPSYNIFIGGVFILTVKGSKLLKVIFVFFISTPAIVDGKNKRSIESIKI